MQPTAKENFNPPQVSQPGSAENPVAAIHHTETDEQQFNQEMQIVEGKRPATLENLDELKHLIVDVMGNKEQHLVIGEEKKSGEEIPEVEIKRRSEPVVKKFVNGVKSLVEELKFGTFARRAYIRTTDSAPILEEVIEHAELKKETLTGAKNELAGPVVLTSSPQSEYQQELPKAA